MGSRQDTPTNVGSRYERDETNTDRIPCIADVKFEILGPLQNDAEKREVVSDKVVGPRTLLPLHLVSTSTRCYTIAFVLYLKTLGFGAPKNSTNNLVLDRIGLTTCFNSLKTNRPKGSGRPSDDTTQLEILPLLHIVKRVRITGSERITLVDDPELDDKVSSITLFTDAHKTRTQ